MGRLVESEEYDPEIHWRFLGFLIDKKAAKISIPIIIVVDGIIIFLHYAGLI